MLAKRKAAKKAAVAAAAVHEKKRQRDSSTSGDAERMGARKPTLTRDDVLEHGNERAELLKKIGDDVNTRLREIAATEDIDADLFDDQRRALLEEARLAAGTKQRVVSANILRFLESQQQRGAKPSKKAPSTEKQQRGEDHHHAMVRVHHNCNAVTAVTTLGTDLVVFGDKSGKVYMADLAPHERNASGMARSAHEARQRHGKRLLEPPMPAAIVSIAVSDTRDSRPTTRDLYERTTVDHSCTSYTAAGAADGSIAVWETMSLAYKGLLFMHRRPITGLYFRPLTSILLSASEDATLRVWSVPEMLSQDKLFGHEGAVTGLHGLRRETCATVGEDGTMRFWRTDAATQQAYSYTTQHRREAMRVEGFGAPSAALSPEEKKEVCSVTLTAVAMLNESIVVCGAEDGSLVVFDVNRRRPLMVKPRAHGRGFTGDGTGLENVFATTTSSSSSSSSSSGAASNVPNPITAVATVAYADVMASASYDGVVRLWRLVQVGSGATAPGRRSDGADEEAKPQAAEMQLLAEIPVCALVTSLAFSPQGEVLYVACSKEPRRGRWVVQRSALNSVCVVPLTPVGHQQLQGMPNMEHIPAQLYGYDAAEDAAEKVDGDDNDEEEHGDEEASSAAHQRLLESLATSSSRQGGAAASAATSSSAFRLGPDGQLIFSRGSNSVKGEDDHAPAKRTEDAARRPGGAKKKLKGAKKSAASSSSVTTKSVKIASKTKKMKKK